MKKHHVDILISEQDVRSRIAELGQEITNFYQHKNIHTPLVVVGLYVVLSCLWQIWCAKFTCLWKSIL